MNTQRQQVIRILELLHVPFRLKNDQPIPRESEVRSPGWPQPRGGILLVFADLTRSACEPIHWISSPAEVATRAIDERIDRERASASNPATPNGSLPCAPKTTAYVVITVFKR